MHIKSHSTLPVLNNSNTTNSSASNSPTEKSSFWGKDGFNFRDLIDIINPLQHIPFVSSLYRNLTGDELSTGARLIGGTALGGVTGSLAGGLMGLAGAVSNDALEKETGKDLGAHIIALFTKGSSESKQIALKAAEAPASPPVRTTEVYSMARPKSIINKDHKASDSTTQTFHHAETFKNNNDYSARLGKENLYLEFLKINSNIDPSMGNVRMVV